jgi:hypothetical protein
MNIEQYEKTIRCPRCRNLFMHHAGVDIFYRDEDDDVCFVVSQNRNSVLTQTRSAPENPSLRRHGIKISFFCEECHSSGQHLPFPNGREAFKLNIYQHKGSSNIWWDDFDDDDDGEVLE